MRNKKQMSIKGYVLPAIALCSFFISANTAHAALVNYSFTGSVSSIDGALLPSAMDSNSRVSGSFQFDNATSGTKGNYGGAVKATTVAIGGYTSSFAPGANAVTIFQNTNLGGSTGDRWKLVTGTTGLPVNGNTPLSFDLQLDRTGGGLFTNTNLQNPPSFSSLTASRWRLLFENSTGDVVIVRGTLNSLTAVPLPAAILLFGAGLISLVGLGAGGLRNLRGAQA